MSPPMKSMSNCLEAPKTINTEPKTQKTTKKNITLKVAPQQTFLKNHYFLIVTFLEIIIDYSTLFACFLLSRNIYNFFNLAQYSERGKHLTHDPHIFMHAAIACGLTIVIFQVVGLYEKKTVSLLNIDEMRKLLRSVMLLAVLVFAISFYFRIPYSRLLITIWISLTLVVMLLQKSILYKLQQYFHIKGMNIRRIVIYGAGEIGRKLYKMIYSFPKLGYRVVGFLDDDVDSFNAELNLLEINGKNTPKIIGTSNDLEKIVQKHDIEELLIAQKGLSPEEIITLTNRCKDMNIHFRIVPQLLGGFIENLAFQEIGGIPLIGERKFRVRFLHLLLKRAIDIFCSLFACIFFTPVFLIIALLIKLDSSGPIIFKQKRIGKDGRVFTILKFRTMFLDSAKYSFCPKNIDDERISRIGKYLRKTSLDELPQFLNVLKGDMSLVGPRPEMPFIVAEYNSLQKKRLSMKPGITGLWQISATRTEEIHQNIDYDLYYVNHYSILLDLAIIVRTIFYSLLVMKTS